MHRHPTSSDLLGTEPVTNSALLDPSRLLVCSINPLMAIGVQTLLQSREGVRPVVEPSITRALATVRQRSPEAIIVVSPALTVDDHNELGQFAALSKVVLLAQRPNAHRSLEVLALGVRAVLSVETATDHLIQVLRTVIQADDIVIPPEAHPAFTHVAQVHGSVARITNISARLTAREKEVAVLLLDGHTNQAIAHKLGIAPATVRTHVYHLLKKLGATNRTQAIALAHARGLVDCVAEDLALPPAAAPLG